MSNVVLNILSEFKGKQAFKQADTAIGKLEKSAKKLGTALGVSLGTAAVVAFGKASLKAFEEDQKSAALLANTIKNLGLSFEQANVEAFIKDLEKSAAVFDEQLRPAMQRLLTTTGDVVKSQKLLKDAIDISRGSGVDLQTTVQDLALAYVGQTKGLKKYSLGISQAQLKAMSFEQILAKLNKQFSGSSSAFLETYAGKVQAINVAFDNLKETVGESLVNAFMVLTDNATSAELADYIDRVAIRMANLVKIVEKFAFIIKFNLDPHNWTKGADAAAKAWEEALKRQSYATAKAFDPTNNAITGYQKDEAAKKKAAAQAAKNAAELKKSLDKQTASLKQQAALKKAQTVFDMQNIQLLAALKGQLTEDEQNRVKALLALNNDNADAAKYYTDLVIKAQDQTGALANLIRNLPTAKNPFENFNIPPAVVNAINATPGTGIESNYPGNFADALRGTGAYAPATNVESTYSGNFADATRGLGAYATPSVNITFTGTDALTSAIASSLQQQSLSSGNVSTINRSTGGF